MSESLIFEIPQTWHEEEAEAKAKAKAKARWFQSLTLSERMDMLCSFTDLILFNKPTIDCRHKR
jgi:hypothetical protein